MRPSFRRLSLLLALLASLPAIAQPVKFYGQDTALPPNGGPYVRAGQAPITARSEFLRNLQASTIQTESFDAFPGGATNFTADGVSYTSAISFRGATSQPNTTGTVTVPNGSLMNKAGIDGAGIYATSGQKFLFSRQSVVFTFDTAVNAFGFYLNDVETSKQIQLTITTSTGTVKTLLYGPVINQNATSTLPGNGQLNFVGFIDKRESYTRVVVEFPNQAPEGFGFDDLTVGTVLQVPATQRTITQRTGQQPGWRLLSAPVRRVTPDALAQLNLVQGITGTTAVAQQYPASTANLYQSYNGGGRLDYVKPATTAAQFVPGRGLWWYWYNVAYDPTLPANGNNATGTSQSVLLNNFELTALGYPVAGDTTLAYTDNTNSASNSGITAGLNRANPFGPNGEVLPADDDFYMIGNPFETPYALSSITATGGTFQDCVFAWNPSGGTQQPTGGTNVPANGPGSYVVLSRTAPLPAQQTSVAVWQGLVAEVTPATVGGTVTFAYPASGKRASETPPFYGRTSEPVVAFRLTGETTDGAGVLDEAAYVRFRDDAEAGWDFYDVSKPVPPSDAYALVAPVGTRDGASMRQAVRSMPLAPATLDLAFLATHAGTYTLDWTRYATGAWTATLLDRVTGETIDLDAGPYTFTSAATGWTNRFELQTSAFAVSSETPVTIAETRISRPMPNPTTGTTRIDVQLDAADEVRVRVFDVLGREVVRVFDGPLGTEARTFAIDASAMAPGVYVVRIDGATVRSAQTFTVAR